MKKSFLQYKQHEENFDKIEKLTAQIQNHEAERLKILHEHTEL